MGFLRVLILLLLLPVFTTFGETVCRLDFDGYTGRIEFLKCKGLTGSYYEVEVIKGYAARIYAATRPQRDDYLPFAIPLNWSGWVRIVLKQDNAVIGSTWVYAKKPPRGLEEVNFPTPKVAEKFTDLEFAGKKPTLSVEEQYWLVRRILETYTPRRFYEKRAIVPLPHFKYISSPFGVSRVIMGRRESFHRGTDFAAPEGTPVLAALSGKVVFAGYLTLTGNTVIIDHGWGLMTLYAHMSKICVKKGWFVRRGTVIGRVGSTGFSTGPHLHFGVYLRDTPVDPVDFLRKELRP